MQRAISNIHVLIALPAALLYALTIISAQSALADAFGLSSAGQNEHYGINYPGQIEMPGASLTPTSHHRLGSQTGIGSSTLQTEANTAEAMPRVQYTPTANAPLAVTNVATPSSGVPQFHLFSQKMLSLPSLQPSVTTMPSLNQMMSAGMTSTSTSLFGTSGWSTSSDSSLDMPILRHHNRSELKTNFLQFDNSLDQP
jgi:hypothetical protein